MMKTKTTKPKATISPLFQIEALLSFKNWTGLTTRELWQAGRLGNHPGEYLMMVASELFPIRTSSDIKKRNMLVSKAIEELNK